METTGLAKAAVLLADIEWPADLKNWDWRAALPTTEWHMITVKRYPGWDRDHFVYRRGVVIPTDYPPTVFFKVTKGLHTSSRDLAIRFDDLAKGAFYYRDWTDSGLPFVDKQETYQSRFWFQKETDRKRFCELLMEDRS